MPSLRGGQRHINGSSWFSLGTAEGCRRGGGAARGEWRRGCAAHSSAHEKRKGANPGPRVLDRDVAAARIAVDVGRVDNPLELIGRKIVGRNLDDLDPSQAESGILDQVAAPNAGPEEADHAPLLLLLGQRSVLPGAAEVEQGVELDLVDVLESLRLGSGKELLLEDGGEFFERGLGDVAPDGIREVGLDGLF